MNPIARKDLVGLLRMRAVLYAHVAYMVVMALIVVGSWPQSDMLTLASRGSNDLQLWLMIAQVALLVLIVPATAAPSIAGEREQNTLEMLVASRLGRAEVVMGKLYSSLAYPLMLLISGTPMLAMLCLRGELDPKAFGLSCVVVACTAILLAVLCLAISSCCQKTSTALVSCYAVVLSATFAVLAPAAILLESQSGALAAMLHYLRGISPLAALFSLLRPNPGDFDGQVHQLLTSWHVFLYFAISTIAACILTLTISLKRNESAASEIAPKKTWRIAKFFTVGFNRQSRRPMNGWNPLLTKERRTDVLRSGRWMMRTFYAVLTLSMLLALMSLYGGSEYGDLLSYMTRVITCLQMGMIALLTPSLTSGAISSEVEGSTLELLRLTPLTSGQHFLGKLLPAIPTAILPIIAMIPAFLAIAFVNPAYLIAITRICTISLLAVLMCCSVALACSAWISETSRSTIVSYLIVSAIFILPLFSWLGSGSVLDPIIARAVAAISPLVVAVNLLPGGDSSIALSLNNHFYYMVGAFILSSVVARLGLQRLLGQSQRSVEP